MKETLERLKGTGELVSIYAYDEEDIYTAHIEDTDGISCLIACFGENGRQDGRKLIRTAEIKSVSAGGQYETKIATLSEFKRAFHKDFHPEGEGSLYERVLRECIIRRIVLTVYLGDISYTGYIRKAEKGIARMETYDEYGYLDSTVYFEKDDIQSISIADEAALDIEIMIRSHTV
jgi:hypothetical protein